MSDGTQKYTDLACPICRHIVDRNGNTLQGVELQEPTQLSPAPCKKCREKLEEEQWSPQS